MNREDVKVMRITSEMLYKAREDAKNLDYENAGRNTREGGALKNVKGSLAQQAVYLYLSNLPVFRYQIEYSDPYQEHLYGDEWDLRIFEETYDVKCRGCWNEKYWYNLNFLMGEHEQKKRVDNYIFATVDDDLEYVYIIGGISYDNLWKNIQPLKEGANLKFSSAGSIHIKHMKPLVPLILHA